MHQERIYYRVLKKLLSDGLIAKNDRILVICAGRFDEEVLHQLGFTRVLLTDASKSWSPSHYKFRTCDAHRLPFADAGFDFSLVHAGLHHCHSPHLALLEMYRVAKKGVLVCEAQDNLFTRLLTRLSLGEKYELSAVKDKLGGVDGTSVPNFIYRWNKWEVEKFVRSLDPAKKPRILYTSEFDFPKCFKKTGKYSPNAAFIAGSFAKIANLLFPQAGNSLCFFIDKRDLKINPWIGKKDRDSL